MKYEALFASPVFTYHVRDAQRLNSELLSDIKALQLTAAGIGRSNQGGWHSSRDFFERPEASFRQLGRALLLGVKEATLEIMPDVNFEALNARVNGWVNVNPTGAYNTPHDHGGYSWSGCYYVQVPHSDTGRSGMIEFLDPRTNMSSHQFGSLQLFGSKALRRPQAGSFLLFPSYLMHWVYPNEEEQDRISIAFNVRLELKGVGIELR
jgi:uncharacterized protein (TIGR02466 family)